MLPILRVQSLIRVADDQYTNETLKHQEKIRDSQVDRDLAGFYVYQNYLKRLRRLHKNYVKKHITVKQQQEQLQQPQTHRQNLAQQQQLKQPIHLPNCHFKDELTATAISTVLPSPNPAQLPLTKFRLPISRSPEVMFDKGRNFDQLETISGFSLLPAISNKETVRLSNVEVSSDYEKEVKLGCKENPIYIPCGRESSAIRLRNLQKRKQERDKYGALSFRLWRSVHGLSRTPYST